MSDYEAAADIKPQIKALRHKAKTRPANRYFLTYCVLLITVMILCVNNLYLFISYKNFKQSFEESLNGMKAGNHERSELTRSNKKLLEENLIIKKENNSLKELNSVLSAQNQEILRQMEEIKKTNEELARKNKELVDDNIALQNSLKKAAAVGIKPQNYTNFDGISSRGELDRGSYLGKFLGTAYTPSADECGNNKGITNSGKPIVPGISVAVDKNHWPYGTVFYIKGLGYAVAMDTGSAIKGQKRFDFAVFDKNFAKNLGSKQWDVYLVKMGKGYVEDIKF
ncbi:MAG: 3D domain-containing protein [Clostridia bacterium]|nr:3D domain-containing protein [Clostridia bacterium]